MTVTQWSAESIKSVVARRKPVAFGFSHGFHEILMYRPALMRVQDGIPQALDFAEIVA